jgi:hypothetical protein
MGKNPQAQEKVSTSPWGIRGETQAEGNPQDAECTWNRRAADHSPQPHEAKANQRPWAEQTMTTRTP